MTSWRNSEPKVHGRVSCGGGRVSGGGVVVPGISKFLCRLFCRCESLGGGGLGNIHLILKGVCVLKQVRKCRSDAFSAPDKLIRTIPGLSGGDTMERSSGAVGPPSEPMPLPGWKRCAGPPGVRWPGFGASRCGPSPGSAVHCAKPLLVHRLGCPKDEFHLVC